MLSIVVVGRNDSHGYNLSKRVATSLNSLSLPMTGEDELIFVDWNSDDINPTFIDAIRDTLTEKTLKHLVVYRVRSNIHQELAKGIKRPILEPVARNVGIRRAKNKWILSTNTDMIFNTHGKVYKDILADLGPNLYHLFRYEIPEYIWDQFERTNTTKTLDILENLFLKNNLVANFLTQPYEGYNQLFPDAVGDFQLTTKDIWSTVKGYPEDMLKGWHVDSRLSVQIEMKNNIKSEILPNNVFVGFHQNHLRILTHFHSNKDINSLEMISEPYSNPDNWGLGDQILENAFYDSYNLNFNNYNSNGFNSKEIATHTLQNYLLSPFYDHNLVDFFLLDDIVNLPIGSQIHISSVDKDFENRLDTILQRLYGQQNSYKLVQSDTFEEIEVASLVILDFGIPNYLNDQSKSVTLSKQFEITINNNIELLKNSEKPQKIALVRAQHWTIRSLIRDYCLVPLFNNYPAILSGQTTQTKNSSLRKLLITPKNLILKSFYIQNSIISINNNFDYSITKKSGSFSTETIFESGIYLRVFHLYKKLPFRIRRYLNPKFRKILKIN